MKIAVLGTGFAGRTVAAALAKLGHEVVIGTRDPQATLARQAPDADFRRRSTLSTRTASASRYSALSRKPGWSRR